jgi:hypothetical protein
MEAFISGVLGAHIGFKTEQNWQNPYTNIDTQQAYPTGAVNGTLTVGEIKSDVNTRPRAGGVVSPNSLHGPLIGKNVTDLTNIVTRMPMLLSELSTINVEKFKDRYFHLNST